MATPKVIPRRVIDKYADALDALTRQAQRETAQAIKKINLSADVDTIRQPLLDLMQAICGTYADAAAVLAARFYELCRKTATGEDYEALTDSNRRAEGTRIAVLGIVKDYGEKRNAKSLITQLLLRVEYETHKAANDCVGLNCTYDPWGR